MMSPSRTVTLKNSSAPGIGGGDRGQWTVTETLSAGGPQLVLFDLDGTLTDSAAGIVASFRHALSEIGATVPDGDLAARIVGPPMHQTLRGMGLGDRADAAVAAYRADYTSRGWAMNQPVRRRPGAAGRPAGRGCAAGRRHLESRAHRAAHPGALRPGRAFRGHRRSQCRRRPRRPRPRWWRMRWTQLAPLPQRVLMVGDRSHDVEGAAAHGIDTVVVGWGYGHQDFDGSTAPPPTATSRTCATFSMSRRCARCSVSDDRCTSRSSARATSAGRRWPRRCSPIRSTSAGWPDGSGSPARAPAAGMPATAPTGGPSTCSPRTAIRPITVPPNSTTIICRPIW